MSWASWSDFWSMGSHGLYVWGSYAVTFALVGLEIAMLRLRRRSALDSIGRSRR